MMTVDEMIEVLEAYKQGKTIEMFVDAADRWIVVDYYPLWDFTKCNYRVKKNPTRLEVANKIWEDTFGISGKFTNHMCPAYECKNCPFSHQSCGASDLETWWDEEYTG